jgi:hypothetical protein
MLLEAKNAAIFAASGAIASQVARRLAAEGAVVWLSARRGYAATQRPITKVPCAGACAIAGERELKEECPAGEREVGADPILMPAMTAAITTMTTAVVPETR